MKPQTRSNLIAILFGCAMLLFIWLFYNEKQARKEAEIISEQLILNKTKELAEIKETAILSIKKDSIKIDSIQSLLNNSKTKQRKTAIYFENELKKIRSISIHYDRQRYADSLAAAMR